MHTNCPQCKTVLLPGSTRCKCGWKESARYFSSRDYKKGREDIAQTALASMRKQLEA